MHPVYTSSLYFVIYSLELICVSYISLGFPVEDVVFPRLLEERSDGGELLVAIRAGQTLSLQKTSVLPKELEVTTFEDGKELIHNMNGTRLEMDLYHDPQARAAIMLTSSGGLRLVGILSPTERIQPSLSEMLDSEGPVQHDIIPIARTSFDAGDIANIDLEDTDLESNSMLSDTHKETGSMMPKARSGQSIYPVKGICETRIVVDSKYFSEFNRNKEQLVKYLAVHVAFANLKFSTFLPNIVKMQLSVTGIVILSEDKEAFIEKHDKDKSIMLATTLLTLNSFVQKESRFQNDDVVVLFTGLEMGTAYKNSERVYKDIVGLANLKGACGSQKAAIVEDVPRTFSSVHTLVHEIGHLLGSLHDGASPLQGVYNPIDPRKCPASEKHIMTSVLGNNMKPDFSYCSTVQVAAFMLSKEGQCLSMSTSTMTKQVSFLDVDETRPSPDKFCERHYTEYPGIHHDKNTGPKLSLQNCVITCSDAARPSLLILNDAPDGTACDETVQSMICMNGKCVNVENNHVLTFGSDVRESVVEMK